MVVEEVVGEVGKTNGIKEMKDCSKSIIDHTKKGIPLVNKD